MKYNKQDKIKEKLKKIKESPITKIIEEYVPVVINTKITKPKSKKNMSPDDKIKNFENVVSSESDNEIKNVKPKKKKKPISSTIKKLVWNTNIGEEKGKSKCLCCKSTEITQMSFHCGHIIAESNGGETIVSNLKPICQNCNSSMGIKDMNEFMKSLK